MGQAKNGSGRPRAVVHRRILDVAESRPDAPASMIAAQVSGATAGLVEDVLAEYGDPADDESSASVSEQAAGSPASDDAADGGTAEQPENPAPAATASDAVDASDSFDDTDGSNRQMTPDNHGQTDESTDTLNGEHEPDVTLSEKQRRALRHVHENPDASQADIAAKLDVTRATVSRWLNDIPGFEWAGREAFAESVFEDGMASPSADSSTTRDDDTDVDTARRLADLADRVDRLETERDRASTASVDISPDLAHRVVHACIESDRISEAEELELLAAFMNESS